MSIEKDHEATNARAYRASPAMLGYVDTLTLFYVGLKSYMIQLFVRRSLGPRLLRWD